MCLIIFCFAIPTVATMTDVLITFGVDDSLDPQTEYTFLMIKLPHDDACKWEIQHEPTADFEVVAEGIERDHTEAVWDEDNRELVIFPGRVELLPGLGGERAAFE